MTEEIPSVIPTIREFLPYFGFMDVSKGGYTMLCTSELVVSPWQSSLWFFKDIESATDVEKGIACDSNITSTYSCGNFTSTNKAIVGDETGILTIFEIQLTEQGYNLASDRLYQHDGGVSALSPIDSNRVITAGTDGSIHLLDIEKSLTETRYYMAHQDSVTSVKVGKQNDLFVSTSYDKTALLWDTRLKCEPATNIMKSSSALSSVSWKNGNEIAIASSSGSVSLIDLRTMNSIYDLQLFEESIHKIAFNLNGDLAACADSNAIVVWNSDSYKIIYESKNHSDMVRDILFHPISGKLYSCGHGTELLTHSL